jgi:hypothetical protein
MRVKAWPGKVPPKSKVWEVVSCFAGNITLKNGTAPNSYFCQPCGTDALWTDL